MDLQLVPAFTLSTNDRKQVDVRVTFVGGKAHDVTFFDSDRDAMVAVPFDLFQRVIDAVAHTVDMNQKD